MSDVQSTMLGARNETEVTRDKTLALIDVSLFLLRGKILHKVQKVDKF